MLQQLFTDEAGVYASSWQELRKPIVLRLLIVAICASGCGYQLNESAVQVWIKVDWSGCLNVRETSWAAFSDFEAAESYVRSRNEGSGQASGVQLITTDDRMIALTRLKSGYSSSRWLTRAIVFEILHEDGKSSYLAVELNDEVAVSREIVLECSNEATLNADMGSPSGGSGRGKAKDAEPKGTASKL